MIAYLGDTRSRKLLARIDAMHNSRARAPMRVGQVVVRGRLELWLRGRGSAADPKRWCYDNGAWADHVAARDFDETGWCADIQQIVALPTARQPDFAVLPDRVAGGAASLALSLLWLARLGRPLSWYLAVQDGTAPTDVPDHPWLDGIFLGGSTAWKLATMGRWAEWCRGRGLPLHVGRVGTMRRVASCLAHDVASCDSALPLFSEDNWQRFFAALTATQQRLPFCRDAQPWSQAARPSPRTAAALAAPCSPRASRERPPTPKHQE